jgi:hypothetical protein
MEYSSNNISEAFSMEALVEIANKVVGRYVYRKTIPSREKDDVVMSIVEKFLNQKKKIESAYEGKSKLTTYFVAILNRMCCEVIRRDSKHWYSIQEGDFNSKEIGEAITKSYEAEKKFAIGNELNRFNNTLLLFNGDSTKVSLFLKCYFDLPIDDEDIMDYAKEKTNEVRYILEGTEKLSKGDLFEKLSKVVNFVEGKNVKGDAVRMWLNKQVEIILNRLNKNGIANHDKESISVLLEIQQNQKQ